MHGGPLGFELQTKVHKNKFLFIFVLSVLLVLVGPYWYWWARGFSQVRFMDLTALPKLVYKCIKHRVLHLSL